jgi:hypothetical protein
VVHQESAYTIQCVSGTRRGDFNPALVCARGHISACFKAKLLGIERERFVLVGNIDGDRANVNMVISLSVGHSIDQKRVGPSLRCVTGLSDKAPTADRHGLLSNTSAVVCHKASVYYWSPPVLPIVMGTSILIRPQQSRNFPACFGQYPQTLIADNNVR